MINIIQSRPSKLQQAILAENCLESKEALNALVDCLFSKEKLICQYACIVLIQISKKNKAILRPYLPLILEKTKLNPENQTLKRNTLRLFLLLNVPESLEGELFDFCINNIADLSQSVAVRAFSIYICTQIAKIHTDLIEELKQVCSLITEDKNPGIVGSLKKCKREFKF